jgi:hypothetical protein
MYYSSVVERNCYFVRAQESVVHGNSTTHKFSSTATKFHSHISKEGKSSHQRKGKGFKGGVE